MASALKPRPFHLENIHQTLISDNIPRPQICRQVSSFLGVTLLCLNPEKQMNTNVVRTHCTGLVHAVTRDPIRMTWENRIRANISTDSNTWLFSSLNAVARYCTLGTHTWYHLPLL